MSRKTSVQESDTAVLLRFTRLVLDMRKAQRNVFAARRKGQTADDAREASQRLEKAVDREAEQILCLTTPSLFDLPPEDGS